MQIAPLTLAVTLIAGLAGCGGGGGVKPIPETTPIAPATPIADKATGPTAEALGEVSREEAKQALDQLLTTAKTANALNELGEEIAEATLAYNEGHYAEAMAVILRLQQQLDGNAKKSR